MGSKYKITFVIKLKTFIRKIKYILVFPYVWLSNYILCKRYPFYRYRNEFTDKPLGYRYTFYGDIPYGWRKAFGKQFSKELKSALIKDGYLKTFRFIEIKEKYGELRLYSTDYGPESSKVLEKYENISIGFCIRCGKPARYCTQGWIEYLCEDCFDSCYRDKNSNLKNKELNEEEYQSYKNQSRLTEKDIPTITRYEKDPDNPGECVSRIVDLKKEYNIDLKQLWGIQDKS